MKRLELMLVLVLGVPVWGQLKGTVQRASGAPLGGVLVNAAGAQTFMTTTGIDGAFQLDIPPGRYDVTIDAPGFEPRALTGIECPGALPAVILKVRKASSEASETVRYQPIVDVERTQQADSIDVRQLMNVRLFPRLCESDCVFNING